MWYLKTRKGTFWIVPDQDKYWLGKDDETLGAYSDVDEAVHDVHDQSTGCLDWDADTKVKVRDSLEVWVEGKPDSSWH